MNFNFLSLIQLDFVYTVPATSTVLLSTWMWPENKFLDSWGDLFYSLSHILNYTPVQFGFYMFKLVYSIHK